MEDSVLSWVIWFEASLVLTFHNQVTYHQPFIPTKLFKSAILLNGIGNAKFIDLMHFRKQMLNIT